MQDVGGPSDPPRVWNACVARLNATVIAVFQNHRWLGSRGNFESRIGMKEAGGEMFACPGATIQVQTGSVSRTGPRPVGAVALEQGTPAGPE